MRPYVSKGAYRNFIDPSLRRWEQAYDGDNFARLVAVKQADDDPDNVFHFAQSIPTRL